MSVLTLDQMFKNTGRQIIVWCVGEQCNKDRFKAILPVLFIDIKVINAASRQLVSKGGRV